MSALRKMRTSRMMVISGVLAIVLVGCGGDDNGDTAPSSDGDESELDSGDAEDADDSGDTAASSDGDDGADGSGDAVDASDECPMSGESVELRVAPVAPVPAGFPAYWLAEGYGFYEEEGLDVELVSPGGSAPPLLLSESLEIAGVGLDYIPEGADEDRLKLFMMTDVMPFLMVTFEDSGIESMSDFEGRKIGINEPHDEIDAQFLLATGGLDPDDYELIPVGQDTAALLAMENGDIDGFMGAFRQANTTLPDVASRPLRLIENEEGSFPGSGPMATNDFLEERCGDAAAFGRAIAKATIWQHENPELSAEVLLDLTPETAEDVEQMTLFLEIANEWHSDVYDNLLRLDVDSVQNYIETWAELGFIDEPYDAEQLVTNEIYDHIFNFDVDTEKEAARSATSPPNG